MKNLVRITALGLCLSSFACTNYVDGVDSDDAVGVSAGGASGDEEIATTSEALSTANWVLQLPTGSGNSPTTISSSKLGSGYSSAYYYKASDGGQIFMVPAKGITTSGSKHCRTEMRESTPSGGQAAWSAYATNSMTVTGKVIKVGGSSKGTVTIGQVFNGTDSIPLAELEYSTGKKGFQLLYEEAKGAGTTVNLNTPITLGAKYTFSMALTKGVLTVTVNGKKVYTHTPSSSILKKKFYFKYGNYDQNTTEGTPSTTPYTTIEAYSVSLTHK